MTSQEKKEFLNRYKEASRKIDRLMDELSFWRNKAVRVSPVISDMPKGEAGENRIQSAIDRIIEIEEEINGGIDDLLLVRQDVQRAVASVQNETLRLLLEYRYLNGRTWEQIAVNMQYDYRWVLRLHGKALDQLTIESHG